MRRSLLIGILLLGTCSSLTVASPQRSRKAKRVAGAAEKPVQVKQENQFIAVEDFTVANKPAAIPVSVEGYICVASSVGSGLKLSIVDSIDHVLSAQDAANFSKGGASAAVSSSALAKHALWNLNAKGLNKYAMYAGAKNLHDTVVRMRVTGYSGGKATISVVTNIEYSDQNGDWKKL